MPNVEPHRLPATTLVRLIDSGELTSEWVVRSCLDHIAEREPVVRAWAHLDRDAVLEAARAADKSGKHGLLQGVPFGVKDIFDTADMPAGYGSPIYTGCRPSFEPRAASLPRDAGGQGRAGGGRGPAARGRGRNRGSGTAGRMRRHLRGAAPAQRVRGAAGARPGTAPA